MQTTGIFSTWGLFLIFCILQVSARANEYTRFGRGRARRRTLYLTDLHVRCRSGFGTASRLMCDTGEQFRTPCTLNSSNSTTARLTFEFKDSTFLFCATSLNHFQVGGPCMWEFLLYTSRLLLGLLFCCGVFRSPTNQSLGGFCAVVCKGQRPSFLMTCDASGIDMFRSSAIFFTRTFRSFSPGGGGRPRALVRRMRIFELQVGHSRYFAFMFVTRKVTSFKLFFYVTNFCTVDVV